MSLSQIVSAAILLGLGGAVGALATAYATALRTSAAFETFRDAYRSYMAGRSDPASASLNASFDELDGDVAQCVSAVDRVKKALSPRR